MAKSITKKKKKMQKTPQLLYIEATQDKKTPEGAYFIDPNFIRTLPKEVFLTYILQFQGQAQVMKKALEKAGIKVQGFEQVLGCSKLKTDYPIILIGNGRFHAINLAVQNKKHPIIIYSNGSSIAVSKRETEELEKRKQGALSKFFVSTNIGILVSTKPGQQHIGTATNLSSKIAKKYPEKNVFLFVTNNINTHEFQNFKIGAWINTACPGLALDSTSLLNSEDILPFL